MPKFSKISKDRLSTCDMRLQKIFNEAIKTYDCTIMCGYRSAEEQNKAYDNKKSKLKYPQSKHNKKPSMAVDVAPYYKHKGIDWNDIGGFYMFAGYIKRIAYDMGYSIRYGGDWDRDNQTKDQNFNDLVHYEIIG